jgi:hypothetical protein
MAMIAPMLQIMMASIAISTAWMSKEGNGHKSGGECAKGKQNG